MTSYVRYHVESGYIDTKISVNDESFLTPYEREGYDFIDCEYALGMHYVEDGMLSQREQFKGGGYKKNAVNGEIVSFSDLPVDMWVTLNSGDPVKITDGSLMISQPDGYSELRIDLVGKYGGTGWLVVWDDVDAMKERAKLAIDTAAESARSRVVTPGSGQAMTYMRKADAARAYLSGGTVSDAQLQRLQDEADRLGVTIQEAAETIATTAEQWEALDASIDSLRLSSKAAIMAESTGAGMENVFRQIKWPV